jgi:hypothetical protein
MSYIRIILVVLFLSVVIVSCQKDQDADPSPTKYALKSDSVTTIGLVNSPGNYLAVRGTLKITVEDSTYTFDATKDSIAFVNVHLDSNKYFGITAINKEHTVSFGISSSGVASANINSTIAGCQLLFNKDDKPGLQYTLTKYANAKDLGKMNLVQYLQDTTLTKGTFFTLLAKDGKPNSPFYKVEGSFNLQLK